MPLSAGSGLHVFSSRYGALPIIGGKPVFTRSSGAAWIDQQGVIQNAIVNTPRFEWATMSAERRQVMRLEQARTNVNDADFASWTPDGASITAGKYDPAGGTNGVLVTHTGGNIRIVRTLPAFTGNTVKAGSIRLAADPGSGAYTSELIVRDTVAVANRLDMQIAWTNGVPTPSIVGGNGVVVGTRALGGGYYEISFTTNSVTAANAHQGQLYPDVSGGTGKKVYAYRLVLENALSPGSVIAPSATRAADVFYWDYFAVPQAQMIYNRHIQRWAADAAVDVRLIEIGAAGDTNPRLLVYFNGASGYRAFHGGSAGSSQTPATLAVPPLGALEELLVYLAADGHVELHQSINGAAVTSAVDPTTSTLAAAWSDTRLYLNSVGSSQVGLNDYADLRDVKAADVVGITPQDRMDELRAYELTPSGEMIA